MQSVDLCLVFAVCVLCSHAETSVRPQRGWDGDSQIQVICFLMHIGGKLSRHLLCALQARPYGLLKPTALGKIPGRFQLHQEALPHLPVPPLQQTLDRYLLALQPIISEEELNHTQELVAEFRKPGGVGERLQKGLERRAKKTENWVGWDSGPRLWLGRVEV